MAKKTFNEVMHHIFKYEGGFVNHPQDPGGATNMGITIGTLEGWRKKPVHVSDVRNLTKAEAMQIYKANYWDKVRGDERPSGLDLVAMDGAVNSGVSRALKWVPITSKKDPIVQIDLSLDTRLNWLKTVETWKTFGKGWTSRIADVRSTAKRIARDQDPTTVVGHTRAFNTATKEAQKRLQELGYHSGLVDGLYGTRTRNSILVFEERHGMNGDGVLNLEEFDILLSSAALEAEKPNRSDNPGELRKRSRIAHKSWLAQILTWIKGFLGIGTVGAISIGDISPAIDKGKEVADSAQGLFDSASPLVWIIGGVVVALVVFEVIDYFLKKQIGEHRMEMHLDGETD